MGRVLRRGDADGGADGQAAVASQFVWPMTHSQSLQRQQGGDVCAGRRGGPRQGH